MRIIQLGKLPAADQEQQSKCKHCGTIFGWFPKEVKLVFDQRDGNFYDIECPFCRGRATVASSLLKHSTP